MNRRISIFILINLFFILTLLSGCSAYNYKKEDNFKQTTTTTQTSYELFQNLDFSKQPIYYYKNFYENLYSPFSSDKINWAKVFEQNDNLLTTVYYSSFSPNLHLDDSSVAFINGQTSYLKIIYNDGINSEIIKTVPIIYIDITKNIDGSKTNLIPAPFGCSTYYKTPDDTIDYNVNFVSYDDDYYALQISKGAKLIEGKVVNDDSVYHLYYSKYIGPKTYFLNDIPIARIWKEKFGYRVDILNFVDANQGSSIKKYFVYSRGITDSDSSSLFTTVTDFKQTWYNISSVNYSEEHKQYEISISVTRLQEIMLHKTFLLNDYLTHTINDENLDNIITIKKVTDKVVNVTLISKTRDRVDSFTLTPNDN